MKKINIEILNNIVENLQYKDWEPKRGHVYSNGNKIFNREQANGYGGGDASYFLKECDKKALLVSSAPQLVEKLVEAIDLLERIKENSDKETIDLINNYILSIKNKDLS